MFGMRTELVSIATDTVPLDGAFHWPENQPARGAILLFHGNAMNFHTGAPRWLPPELTDQGFACLAFNRRGHDILTIRDSRAPEGGALQSTREGIAGGLWINAARATRFRASRRRSRRSTRP